MTKISWQTRFLLAVGKRLLQWGQQLLAQAVPPDIVPPPPPAVDVLASGQLPPHWLALLQQSEIPIHWLGNGEGVEEMPAHSPSALTFSPSPAHPQPVPLVYPSGSQLPFTSAGTTAPASPKPMKSDLSFGNRTSSISNEPSYLSTTPAKRPNIRFAPVPLPTTAVTPNFAQTTPSPVKKSDPLLDNSSPSLASEPDYVPVGEVKRAGIRFAPIPSPILAVTSDFASKAPSTVPKKDPLLDNRSLSAPSEPNYVPIGEVKRAGTPNFARAMPIPGQANAPLFGNIPPLMPSEPTYVPPKAVQSSVPIPSAPFSTLPPLIQFADGRVIPSPSLTITFPVPPQEKSVLPVYNRNPTPAPVLVSIQETASKLLKVPLPHFDQPSTDRWPPLPAENDLYHHPQPMPNRDLADHWQRLGREQEGG